MREIKFRAWHKKNKAIIPWKFILELLRGRRIYLPASANTPQPFISDPDTKVYSIASNIFTDEDFILMQYTGLKDKNGKEIYDGDIVKGPKYLCDNMSEGVSVGLVKESEIELSCGAGYTLGWYIEGDNQLNFPSCEVIGNIHENPELLK